MSDKIRFYVGAYTENVVLPEDLKHLKKGIYCVEFDADASEVKILSVMEGVENPSFLALDKEQCFLYAVNESGSLGDGVCGGVSSFRINGGDGSLNLINRVSSLGAHPCHVMLDGQGRRAFVSNYSSGNGCIVAVGKDGVLGEAVEIPAHAGQGWNPERQERAHAHSMTLDRQGKRVLMADLGLDKIFVYDYNEEEGSVTESDVPFYQVKEGSGPRHCEFDEDGKLLYFIQELSGEVVVLEYQAESGTFEELQTISTLSGAAVENSCADIHLTPDGRFLYASNRGEDNLAVYERDRATGLLRLLRWESTAGRSPRSFAISGSGKYLIAANQESNNVVVFEIDGDNGRLEKRCETTVPAPVCIRVVD